MAGKYAVTQVRNSVYLDKAGKAIQGFTLSVALTDYDEEIELKVASLEPKVVEAAVTKLLSDRAALAALGK